MDAEKMNQALDAIRNLAVRLLSQRMPPEVATGLRHINKVARHKTPRIYPNRTTILCMTNRIKPATV